MSWNYRIVRKNIDGTQRYGIHEAYCDEKGLVFAITVEPVSLVSFKEHDDDSTPEEMLKIQLGWMMKATEKPTLDWDKIPENDAESPYPSENVFNS